MQTQEFNVFKEWAGKSLQEVISLFCCISRGAAKKLVDSKQVFVNDKRIWMAKHLVKAGDMVSLTVATADAKSVVTLDKKNVIYHDQHIVVINKPVGLLANGKNSAELLLQREFEDENIRAVHRLDRDTSGCLIFSHSQEAWDAMFKLFKDKQISKTYHALCVGVLTGEKERDVLTPIEGRDARSKIKLLKQLGELALVEVTIETGRTHQIRKHLLSINLPVLGDKDYYSRRSESKPFRSIPRQMLHAYKLSFTHPLRDSNQVSVTAPYPQDFADLLRKATRNNS